MKGWMFRTALVLALLGATVAPAAAAPWCADYCDCSSPCWALCYDEGGASACAFYICECNLAAADPADELLRAIFAPATEAPATEASAAITTR